MKPTTPMPWPQIDELIKVASLPDDVTLRLLREDEFDSLPEKLNAWYPEALVGSESVFLNPGFLRQELVREDNLAPNIYAMFIMQKGEIVGLTTYERQPASGTLQARLGALAPSARSGFLGALGFLTLEKLATLTGAELILVWITLRSRHQQFFAERRGFHLVGVVPGLDRELVDGKRTLRVSQALLAKLLVPESAVLAPTPDALTPRTQRVLDAILRG